LQRDPAERDGYLRQACRDDSGLRREVASLLANHSTEQRSESWAAAAAAQLVDSSTSIQPGQSLGPYRIESFLAAGGMGEVYRATDTRLHREVAIKVCAERFSERFAQEARVIASLNHPHICHLYDVGPNYLVMELVEGPTLADRIRQGALPLEEALSIARQIAEGLEAAHEKGKIHRDLKPANVKITPEGVVKLLDFGLAKAAEEPVAADQSNSPTMTISPTRAGVILGTAAYMSPEQARGSAVDKRSDIWAFGVVVYEMLTGRALFAGETVSDTLAAVLKSDPDWNALPAGPPASIRRLLRRCLERDRKRRLHDIGDARIEIEEALAEPQAPAAPAPTKQQRLGWIAAAALLLSVFGIWQLWRAGHLPKNDPVIRFHIPMPSGGRFVPEGAFGGGLAVSPDGRTVAFVTMLDTSIGLWVRPLDATDARLLPGTNGATGPFWSPDSKSIAFSSSVGVGRSKLQAFDLARGTLVNICDISGTFIGGAWSSDGRILFGTAEGGLLQVAASGGTPSPFTAVDRAHGEIFHGWPQMLPGGRFLYSVRSIESENETVYAAPVRDPSRRVLLLSYVIASARGLLGPSYVRGDDGREYLFWIRGTTLVGQQFDSDQLQVTGDAFPVAEPAERVSAGSKVLVYAPSHPTRQYQWFDRGGRPVGILGEPAEYVFGRISPDGRRVVAVRAGIADMWLLETARPVASRLTSRGIHISPLWSPDGRTILFATGTPFNLYRIPADGSGSEELVSKSENRQVPTDWSKNGRLILYSETAGDTGLDLWTLEVTPEGKPRPGAKPQPYIRAPYNQTLGRFSPDTRWVAYQSDESGRWEAYVQSFPDAHEKVRISTAGGRNPEWGPEGRELFYVSPDGKLMAVTMKFGTGSVEPSLPRELFALPVYTTGLGPFEVAADGQRFLAQVTTGKIEPLTVIVNWPALVKRGAGAP
jgi:serine/threonine protein kinase/Tol biopolymer transport system component